MKFLINLKKLILAIKYKEGKDVEIKNLNRELDNLKKQSKKIILYMSQCLTRPLNHSKNNLKYRVAV